MGGPAVLRRRPAAGLIVGPWLLRTWRSPADERQERIRPQILYADVRAPDAPKAA